MADGGVSRTVSGVTQPDTDTDRHLLSLPLSLELACERALWAVFVPRVCVSEAGKQILLSLASSALARATVYFRCTYTKVDVRVSMYSFHAYTCTHTDVYTYTYILYRYGRGFIRFRAEYVSADLP